MALVAVERGKNKMCNFWNFVGFEYKKMLGKKMVWAAVLIAVLLCLLSAVINTVGNIEVDGTVLCSNYEEIQRQKEESLALSGRPLDDDLLGEMQEAYSKVGTEEGYTMTMAYWENAFPYSDVFGKARQIGEETKVRMEGYSEENLYAWRKDQVAKMWDEMALREGEKTYLSGLEEKVQTPFTYQYCDGWERVMAMLYTNGVIMAVLIAICVPVLFSEDHLRRTDQLVLTSRFGRRPVYLAKVFTGLTFSVGMVLLLALVTVFPTFLIYGAAGADTGIQLMYPQASWDLTAAEMTGILLLLAVAAALVLSSAAMVLAEKTRSSTVPMAVMISFLMITMLVNVPDEHRVLAQIWNWLPTTVVSVWNGFDCRMLPTPFTGVYLTVWQAVPAIYAAAAALLLGLGSRIYQRFQADGR